MISHFRNSDNGEFLMTGLSTDEKPIEDVPNGAIFVEMDTSQTYRFDKSTGNYLPSAGGGGNVVIHGKQVITENGTYDVWDKDEVEVNVIGGGGDFAAMVDGTLSVAMDSTVSYIRYDCFTGYDFDADDYVGVPITIASFPAVEYIDAQAFYNCSNLTIIDFPLASVICSYAFAGCSALSSVSVPSAKELLQDAFARCEALASIMLPSIEYIDNDTFAGCSALSEIYLLGSSVCSVSGHPFFGTPFDDGDGAFYVPSSMYDAYLDAPFWVDMSDYIHIYDGAENAGGEP